MRAKYYRPGEADREPEEITAVLGSIISRVGTGASVDAGTLIAEWNDIAPERWRARAHPVGLRGRVLLVAVRSGADATVLRHDAAELLRRISDRFGDGLVDDVRIRVSPQKAPRKNV
jgi:predicted nucleic acid-binding Zn ribbon protein